MTVLIIHTVYDISTHALTEGDNKMFDATVALFISTHALTEGDE